MKHTPKTFTSLLLGLIAALTAHHAFAQLAVQPYLQLSPEGGITVMWNTEKPAYGWVEYGPTAELGHKADLVIEGLRNANTTRHKVVFPFGEHQTLHYRLAWKNITAFGPYSVTFEDPQYTEILKVSQMPTPDQAVRVAIFNDTHDNLPLFEKLVAQLEGFDFHFSVFNGDCFADPASEERFIRSLNVYNKGVDSAQRPVIYHRGNHEYRGAFARELRSWFSPPGGHFYGAFSAGPVRFVMLDAGEDKPDENKEYSGLIDFTAYRKEQAEFLKQELAGDAFLDATYRILIHHIPLYNERDAVFSRLPREVWEDVLNGAPITLGIHGHTHRHIIHPTNAIGNPYPLAIGGGNNDASATVTKLEITPEKLTLEMLNVAGEVVEALEIPAP